LLLSGVRRLDAAFFLWLSPSHALACGVANAGGGSKSQPKRESGVKPPHSKEKAKKNKRKKESGVEPPHSQAPP
jgi:hypothetical protein